MVSPRARRSKSPLLMQDTTFDLDETGAVRAARADGPGGDGGLPSLPEVNGKVWPVLEVGPDSTDPRDQWLDARTYRLVLIGDEEPQLDRERSDRNGPRPASRPDRAASRWAHPRIGERADLIVDFSTSRRGQSSPCSTRPRRPSTTLRSGSRCRARRGPRRMPPYPHVMRFRMEAGEPTSWSIPRTRDDYEPPQRASSPTRHDGDPPIRARA